MKTGQLTLIFLALILSASCSEQNTGSYDKKQALKNYSVCSQLADEWLKKLDSTDYSHLISIEQLKAEYEGEISTYINEARRVYGKVIDRKLIGSHIYFYSSQSLLAYALFLYSIER